MVLSTEQKQRADEKEVECSVVRELAKDTSDSLTK